MSSCHLCMCTDKNKYLGILMHATHTHTTRLLTYPTWSTVQQILEAFTLSLQLHMSTVTYTFLTAKIIF